MASTPDALQLEPAAQRAYVVLFALMLVLPLTLELVLTVLEPGMGPALTRSVDASLAGSRLLGTGVVAAIAGVAFVAMALLMRRHRVRLDAKGLEVATSFYRRRLSWGELRLDAARVVRIDERPELKPLLRSNGVAVPGFRSGWFRSRNFSRMFVATSGGKKLLWLPTSHGYDLLLQPRQPARLLERLRELAAAQPVASHRAGR